MRLLVPLVVLGLSGCMLDSYPSGNSSGQNNNGGTTVSTDVGTFEIAPDDVRVANAWTIAELQALPRPQNAVIYTVIKGFEPVVLPVVLEEFVASPMTGATAKPYPYFRMDERNAWWKTKYDVPSGASGSSTMLRDPKTGVNRLVGALAFSLGGGAPGTAPFIVTPFELMRNAGVRGSGKIAGFGEFLGAGVMYSSHRNSRFLERVRAANGIPLVSPELYRTPTASPVAGSVGGTAPPLRGGSNICVNIVRGDLNNMSACGAVTAVDGTNLWAFGHPFFAAGDVVIPYSAGWVTDVVSHDVFGTYKLMGPIGPSLGTITGDWFEAIRGTSQKVPSTIHIQTTANPDGCRGCTQLYHHDVTRLDPWTDSFTVADTGVYWPLEADRTAHSSGHVTISVRVSYLETAVAFVKRETVATPYDLSSEAAWWAKDALSEAFAADAQVHRNTVLQVSITITWDK